MLEMLTPSTRPPTRDGMEGDISMAKDRNSRKGGMEGLVPTIYVVV